MKGIMARKHHQDFVAPLFGELREGSAGSFYKEGCLQDVFGENRLSFQRKQEMENWDLGLPWIIHLIWHAGSGPG